MARESQGLQIALIVCVIFTILFMVTTFIFVSQYREAATERDTARTEKQEAETAARNTTEENMKLRALIGGAATESMEALTEQFNNQIKEFAASLPEGSQTYTEALRYLYNTLNERSSSLSTANDTIKDLTAKIEGLEKAKEPLVAQQQQRADQASATLMQETNKFQQDRAAIVEQQQQLQAQLQQQREKAQADQQQLQTQLASANARIEELGQRNRDNSRKINEILTPTFETPDGKILWVDQRFRTVWIDLGHGDALRRLVTFSVYPADTSDVSQVGGKASIEVTKLLGAHLAEARLIEDDPSNPVMAGDVIYTPVWAPGAREHFALTNGLDINNNGKSDLDRVLSIIRMNGGVVDYWIDDEGNAYGEMTPETRFLIVGRPTEPTDSKEAQNARTEIERAADERGLTRMNLPELLNKMGWREHAPVTTFGGAGDAADFRALPPEGIPPRSTGTVSPLFQERRPPRPTSRTAY